MNELLNELKNIKEENTELKNLKIEIDNKFNELIILLNSMNIEFNDHTCNNINNKYE